MSKMNKKNKHRTQGNRGSSPPQTPPPPAPGPQATPTEETRRAVETVVGESDIAAALAEVADPPPVPEEAPPGRSLDELRRDVEGARRRFDAAIEALHQKQRAADEAKREADAARARADEGVKGNARRGAEIAQQEAALVAREERIVGRELDAEQGFLALRRERLGPLDREREAMRAELSALRDGAAEARARIDREHAEHLAAQEAEWRRLAGQRTQEAEAERRALDAALSEARAGALAEARRQAAEIVARASAEAEAEREALDAREASLRERERSLRAAKNELIAGRELLDEDRAAFDARVADRAGVALREANERAARLEDDLRRARAERDGLHVRGVAFEELERRLGGRSPEEVLRDLEAQRAELRRLRDELAARPTEAERVRLAELERELMRRDDEAHGLRTELAGLKRRLATREIAAVELESLRDQKEALASSRSLLKTAHDELRAEVDSLTKKDDDKNPMASLVEIDRQASSLPEAPRGFAPKSLRELVDDLRARLPHAVEGRVLHYSERDVRAFVGGMAMTPLLLLQGISGTGKTSLPKAMAGALGGDHAVIEVQAGWRDRQDLLGYYNAFHRHFYASNFLQALYRAGTAACRDRVTLIVLDEINLSRVEQFFADFLSAIEQPDDERRITLMSDPVSAPPALLVEGRHLPIPPNVWFVGTANHDETTTAFADKTYDRAHVMELPRHPPVGAPVPVAPSSRSPISCEALRKLFDTARTAQAAQTKTARSWLDAKDGVGPLLEREFRLAWGNRLERDIERYVPVVCESGGTVGEAVDHLLHTKLLRKLRDRHDVGAQGLERLRSHLRDAWLDARSPATRSLELVDRELHARRGGEQL